MTILRYLRGNTVRTLESMLLSLICISKLEKQHIKLNILAFKLLRNANTSKQERLIVLIDMIFASKENMYNETKPSLIKFMEDLTEGKTRTGLDIILEPAWRMSISINCPSVYISLYGHILKSINH